MERLRKRIAYLYLSLGLLLSASVSWYLFQVENDRIYQDFRRDLERHCTAIERLLVQHFETVHGLASTLSFFRHPDPEAFQTIAGNTRRRIPAIASVAWFWYLPSDERDTIEAGLTEHYGAFSVRQGFTQATGSRAPRPPIEPASPVDRYLTLVAVQPDTRENAILGLDLFDRPAPPGSPGEFAHDRAIRQALHFAHAESGPGPQILTLSAPILRPRSADGGSNFIGLVSAAITIESLLKRARHREIQDWSISISEKARHLPTRIIFTSGAAAPLAPERFSHTRTITIEAGHQWAIEARATAHYVDSRRTHMPETVLGCATIITAMLFCIWHIQLSRTRDIEDLVAARTRALSAANLRLRELSHTDPLTGVANRRLFNQRLHAEWLRLRRAKEYCAVIMIDVDHFKAYNDSYGHPQGDQCLSELAQCIANTVQRPADLVARYGGEEFVVLLPQTDAKALQLARDILIAVRNLNIPHERSRAYRRVTISIGFSWARAHLLDSPKQLIAAADRALYHAKAAGRNRIAFTPAKSTQNPQLLTVEE